ncbi:hypothetical protein KCV01_g4511, partial [Aureobasidium melanogenum]
MREGSLSAAARALGMTQPSLGRHVRELEDSLGVPLFARGPQGLAPTDAARELLPHAESMAAAVASMWRAASGAKDESRGVVRITASEVMGTEVLPRLLVPFRRAHPGIVIELSTTDRMANLLRRDADIAVRNTPPSQDALVARHACRVPMGFFAHPDYLDVAGRPRRLEDLREHTMIGYDEERPHIRALRPAGLPYAREDFSFRTDNDLAAIAAMRAGYGIGICQAPLGRRYGMERLFPRLVDIPLDTWVVTHEDLRASRRVRAVFDHLAQALAAYPHE